MNGTNLIPPPDFNLNGQPLPENHSLTLADFEQYRITNRTEISKPIPIIKIAGEIISTPEALTVISGSPKSGKSAFCSILIAGAIASGEYDGLSQVEVLQNADHKAVIHLDTEQAPWKHQSNLATILKRANMIECPDYYLSYNIRQLDIELMQQIVSEICHVASERFNGIHSIFIDGIADFIKDPNDPGASFDIVKYFESIAQTYFCSVITIVHTNPGSDKERGHLGSQVQRKAEGILTVKKEGNVSYIDPKLLRHAGDDIPKIQFRYDYEKGYHVGCDVDSPQDRKVTEKINKLKKIRDAVFSGQRSYTWSPAIEAIMSETALSHESSRKYLSEMKTHNMIIQGDDKNWRQND